MEPVKIEINIGLKPETIDAVKQLMLASVAAFMELCRSTEAKPAEASQEGAEAPAEAEPETKPEAAPAAPQAPAVDDMPDFTEAFPEVSDKEIADVTRAAVVRLREAGISPTIIRKEVFEKYGISQSSECPMEKRGQLVADLNAIGR